MSQRSVRPNRAPMTRDFFHRCPGADGPATHVYDLALKDDHHHTLKEGAEPIRIRDDLGQDVSLSLCMTTALPAVLRMLPKPAAMEPLH